MYRRWNVLRRQHVYLQSIFLLAVTWLRRPVNWEKNYIFQNADYIAIVTVLPLYYVIYIYIYIYSIYSIHMHRNIIYACAISLYRSLFFFAHSYQLNTHNIFHLFHVTTHSRVELAKTRSTCLGLLTPPPPVPSPTTLPPRWKRQLNYKTAYPISSSYPTTPIIHTWDNLPQRHKYGERISPLENPLSPPPQNKSP